MSALIFMPTLAWAEEAHAQHSILSQLSLPLVNFSLYFLLILAIIIKKVSPILSKRASDIEGYLNKAEKVLKESEARLALIKTRQIEIEQEKAKLRNDVQASSNKISETVIRNAHLQAAQLLDDSLKQIDKAVAQAKAELRQEEIKQATAKAREALAQRLTEDADRKLRLKVLDNILEQSLLN